MAVHAYLEELGPGARASLVELVAEPSITAGRAALWLAAEVAGLDADLRPSHAPHEIDLAWTDVDRSSRMLNCPNLQLLLLCRPRNQIGIVGQLSLTGQQ